MVDYKLNNSNQRFSFYAGISGALQRMERLSKVGEINKQELENCVYSRATLSSLSLVLPNDKARARNKIVETKNGIPTHFLIKNL